jgi:hypothetical protein
MAIYKIAELHLLNWQKTGILNREEEMYLRFKALAYIDPKDSEEIRGVDIAM